MASALHANFYEDWQSGESVAEALDDVERFVNKLEPAGFRRVATKTVVKMVDFSYKLPSSIPEDAV